jgi:Uma2 family endonuclease
MNRVHEHHWTVAEYLRLPDDGTRCEIIEGERLMTPSPWTRHQIVSANLVWVLSSFVRAAGLGRVLCAPSDVFLSEDTVVQPDVYFVSKVRDSIIHPDGVFAAPDLVIEILSPSHPERDTVRKLGLYARHGVREYWIVDPDSDRIDVFVLEGSELVRKESHSDGEIHSLAVLPGFSAKLAEIFAK